MNPFDYNSEPTNDMRSQMEFVRGGFKNLAKIIEDNCPAGRERALVMTNLEQAAMWAMKSITHVNASQPTQAPKA